MVTDRWFALRAKSEALLDAPVVPAPPRDPFAPDVLERWAERMPPKPEPEKPAPKLDNGPPIDIRAEVAAAIEAEHAFMTELLAELYADLQARANDDLERATRMLTCELAELRATLGELRATIATERIERTGKATEPVDLPALPRREMN